MFDEHKHIILFKHIVYDTKLLSFSDGCSSILERDQVSGKVSAKHVS